MKTFKISLLLAFICMAGIISAQSQLVKDLKKGKDRTLVVYGTCVAKLGGGPIWVQEVSNILNKKYSNHLTVLNRSGSGRSSEWATYNIKDSVLVNNPDIVLIEFAANDPVQRFDISPEQSKKNVQYLIDEVKKANPKAEIMLMIASSNPLGGAKEKRADVSLYNEKYRELAKENKLMLIDLTPSWDKILGEKGEKGLKIFQPDGVHMSRKGAVEIVAPAIVKVLEKEKEKGK